ncbi:flagellar basal-body rod protein FlgG [Hydrogenoanaerobacterium saccharovorans]|uniref:Flagellar basal-body rod protein FlgG n=1 Tax=Hydrogenoanaerobacterium saccharovorans TaxID=474960 RepID=A0A1H7ZUG0_9FIRM|nr:flagellar hook-basal body protein [Hydrogenoanaerobacterium saccharovorans]RPF48409.1 flagellar basal-body rod protein FlgG [Hydrogenoanaerobacterium saccharovorans]SEM61424.1 flagellar basal-body rod protein FlgG [Hydrogenoanaerobacterium saccharovorans]
MNTAFYTAVSGMTTFQKDMDLVSNNMANINTVGYKPQKSSFSDLLYTQMNTRANGNFMTGHGVKIENVDMLFKQGMLNRTEYGLDFALVGEGFFCVDRGGENLEYTRNGSFSVGMDRKRAYLVTSDGGYVLDDRGRRIELNMKDNSNVADIDGIEERIGIYTFSNPYGLKPIGNTSLSPTELSGEAKAVRRDRDESEIELISGALELSDVDMSAEMVNVLQTQRAFQLNAKIVQTADQIEEMVNNLR